MEQKPKGVSLACINAINLKALVCQRVWECQYVSTSIHRTSTSSSLNLHYNQCCVR